MGCFHPIPALQQTRGGPVILGPPLGTENLALPCGKCLACRKAHATQWADRCQHEAKYHAHNCFVTLTYDNTHLPPEGHLRPKDLTDFWKRLRKRASYAQTTQIHTTGLIRYFAAGEYGTRTARPHYHAIIFNCDFADKQQYDTLLATSDTLGELWPHGDHKIGTATGASASYIAQYTLTKEHANNIDADGVWKPKPFLRMSRNLGEYWLHINKTDLTHGYLVAGNQDKHKHTIPRAYAKILTKNKDQLIDTILYNKYRHNIENPTDNNTEPRRKDQEIIANQKANVARRNAQL